MGADNSLLLRVGEDVHHAAIAVGPVTLCKAMHQRDIDIFHVQFFPEALDVRLHPVVVARPGLGEDGHFLSRDALQRLARVRMAAVGVGEVEEAQALVVAVIEQIGQALDAERCLVGVVVVAHGARAHRQARGLDARRAERNDFGSTELSGRGQRVREWAASEPCGSNPGGGP